MAKVQKRLILSSDEQSYWKVDMQEDMQVTGK